MSKLLNVIYLITHRQEQEWKDAMLAKWLTMQEEAKIFKVKPSHRILLQKSSVSSIALFPSFSYKQAPTDGCAHTESLYFQFLTQLPKPHFLRWRSPAQSA